MSQGFGSIPEVPARLQLPLLEYWLAKSSRRSGRFEVGLADRSANSCAAGTLCEMRERPVNWVHAQHVWPV
ncbi:hypothetical protein D918_01972 [Trichuris suis]|nr:hypothetical protein D918_01972 [Trichuris suis]